MNSKESKKLFDEISKKVYAETEMCCKLAVLIDQIVRIYEGFDLIDEKFRILNDRYKRIGEKLKTENLERAEKLENE